jgi:antitoxin (DNA-binding transcriptional repressor) of toxin-antitoxin stability system
MVTRITATELARNLSAILNRVRYRGESFVIERNGEDIASIAPHGQPGITMKQLAATMSDVPILDEDFEKDLEAARSILREPELPEWPN